VGTGGFATFQGKMLVASDEAMFPSQNVFCQRAGKSYKTGIFKYDQVQNEAAKRYITRPTFKEEGIIS